jgi:hypothetical protein
MAGGGAMPYTGKVASYLPDRAKAIQQRPLLDVPDAAAARFVLTFW